MLKPKIRKLFKNFHKNKIIKFKKIPNILRILIVEHFFEAIGNLVGIIFFRKIFIKSIKING